MPQIDLSPSTKAWIQLIALTVGEAAAVTGTAYAGGCKFWVAILTGLGSAGLSVYHAVSDAPADKQP